MVVLFSVTMTKDTTFSQSKITHGSDSNIRPSMASSKLDIHVRFSICTSSIPCNLTEF